MKGWFLKAFLVPGSMHRRLHNVRMAHPPAEFPATHFVQDQRSPKMTDLSETQFKFAYEKVEQDIVNISALATDLAAHIGQLNSAALLAAKPTIDFQPFGMKLNELISDLDAELTKVPY